MRELKRVVVLGANGTMGAGASGLFAANGFDVTMLARTLDKARQGLGKAKEALGKVREAEGASGITPAERQTIDTMKAAAAQGKCDQFKGTYTAP